MRIFLKSLIALTAMILLAPCVWANPSGTIVVTTLPSGMKLIVREGREVNLAAVDIWVKAGSINETPENNGISHFVEHMIFKTTAKYGPGQIDREIEGLGAELNGGTSKDWVHFYTTIASEYLPLALNALADAVTTAQFREDDIVKERQVLLDEIARAESDPDKRVMDLFAQTAYGLYPYALSPTGAKDVMSKLTRDELYAYYKRMYVPANVCVVIAGDVTADKALDMVKKAFAGFAAAGKTAPVPPVPAPKIGPPPTQPRAVKHSLPVAESHIVLGFMSAQASNLRESCALDVMATLLGSANNGRLASALNASGIRFTGISADYISQKYPSVFSVHVTADPADADKVPSIVLTELRRLATAEVDQGELFRAKRTVEGGDLFEQETFSGQARSLGMYDAIASWDLSLKYGPTIGAITSEDISAVAAKYFFKDNYTLLVLEPEGRQK